MDESDDSDDDEDRDFDEDDARVDLSRFATAGIDAIARKQARFWRHGRTASALHLTSARRLRRRRPRCRA
jgi:hypothetical protein